MDEQALKGTVAVVTGAAPTPFLETTAQDLDDAFHFNAAASFERTQRAVPHLLQSDRASLAPRIRANGIAPGVVATKGLEDALDAQTRQHILDATPLHRLATVEDVANVALWLASPESSYVTGKIIELDGGAERPVVPDASADLQA